MIKEIDIPDGNDVVEINEKDSLITVSGKIKLDTWFNKLVKIEKKDRKLILQVPSNEEKHLGLLNSTIERINKLFKMTLYPHFDSFGGSVCFPAELGWVMCFYPFRAAVKGMFDTPEKMINAFEAVSKQLLTDGFIPEPAKDLNGKDVFEINDDTIKLLTKMGDIYFRPKVSKNIRKYEKIRIEFRIKEKQEIFCEVSGEFEYFTYFKEYILPIFKKTSNAINLCALAPPNYDEKPLYYPLLQFLYYPDGKIEDNSVYCTKENEYKNEYGFKPEVLNREFKEWDGEMPHFAEFGEVDFPCKADHKGLIAGLSIDIPSCVTLSVILENPNEMKEISRVITQRLIKDGFTPTSLGDFRKDGDAFIPKELPPSKIDGYMEMRCGRNNEDYSIVIIFGRKDWYDSDYHYNFFEIGSDWNGKIFTYLLNTLIPSLKNLSWRIINLMAAAPPDYKEKPLYYPLIDITLYPDGTVVDKTVYVTKKNNYKDEIGFKEEILDRKFRKSKSK